MPYLGAATGFVVAMCVAIAQFWPDWIPLAIVGGIFLVGENLADYVLAPRIIGQRVKLNPVWLMFSLFAFGYLFGFIGLLIAIPLAASLGVIVRFAMRELLDGPAHETTPAAASTISRPAVSKPRGHQARTFGRVSIAWRIDLDCPIATGNGHRRPSAGLPEALIGPVAGAGRRRYRRSATFFDVGPTCLRCDRDGPRRNRVEIGRREPLRLHNRRGAVGPHR